MSTEFVVTYKGDMDPKARQAVHEALIHAAGMIGPLASVEYVDPRPTADTVDTAMPPRPNQIMGVESEFPLGAVMRIAQQP